MTKIWIGLVGMLVGAACTQLIERDMVEQNNIKLLEQHIQDFNRHDADALVANMNETFGWYQLEGDRITVEADSLDALLGGMKGYFSGVPSVQSRTGNKLTIGSYVATVESVQWQNKSGEYMQQASLSVYQMENNKIKNVWYFPATSQ